MRMSDEMEYVQNQNSSELQFNPIPDRELEISRLIEAVQQKEISLRQKSNECSQLQSENSQLKNNNSKLQSENSQLKNNYSQLDNAYSQLKNNFSHLENVYSQLKNFYDEQERIRKLTKLIPVIFDDDACQYDCVIDDLNSQGKKSYITFKVIKSNEIGNTKLVLYFINLATPRLDENYNDKKNCFNNTESRYYTTGKSCN